MLSIHPNGRRDAKKQKFEPRTRENIGDIAPGVNTATGERINGSKVYPGGKHRRRRMMRLAARQAAFARDYAPGAKGGKGVSGEGYMTKPGSMK